MAHIKLFESWLSDIANTVKSAFTGDAGTASTQSDSEFKTEFENSITDISSTAKQSDINPSQTLDKYFVVHHTAGRGSAEGVVNTLNTRNLGVQWVIDRDGQIFKTFPEGVTAWHAGTEAKDRKPGAPDDLKNDTAQGVEVIANNDSDILPIQVLAAFKLLKYLGYGKDDVWGHGEITYNKESTEGKTIVDFWRENWNKSPTEAEAIIQAGSELAANFNKYGVKKVF